MCFRGRDTNRQTDKETESVLYECFLKRGDFARSNIAVRSRHERDKGIGTSAGVEFTPCQCLHSKAVPIVLYALILTRRKLS